MSGPVSLRNSTYWSQCDSRRKLPIIRPGERCQRAEYMIQKKWRSATANRLPAAVIRKVEAHLQKKRALYRRLARAEGGPISAPA